MRITKKIALKNYAVIFLFIILTLVGLVLSKQVKINYSLSDYLNETTETRIAIDIIEDEFGMTGNVQVMLPNIDKETANAVKDELADIDGVLNVSFNADSEDSYKNGNALFVVLLAGTDYSDVAKNAIADIKATLSDRYQDAEFGGSAIEQSALRESTQREMSLIITLVIILTLLLLLITSSSFIEPLLLLASSGIAMGINMGLNLLLGEISYITNAIAAILQLALSIDYSIMLLHAFREIKRTERDSRIAMKQAVSEVVHPVFASAFTTIAGLGALLFMTFTIGFDIGVVLMKGIVVSMITSLVLFPTFILTFEKLIKKTRKRAFEPKGKMFATLAVKRSKIVVPIALVVIIATGFLQGSLTYGFTDNTGENQKIIENFSKNNTIVLVYEKGDVEEDTNKEEALGEYLKNYKNGNGQSILAGYTANSTTVREKYDIEKAISVVGLPRSDIEMLYTMYHLYEDKTLVTMTSKEFVEFTDYLMENDEDVGNMVGPDMKKTIGMLNTMGEVMSGSHTASALHALLSSGDMSGMGISLFSIEQMYGLYSYDKVASPKVNFKEMLSYLQTCVTDPNFSDNFSSEMASSLKQLEFFIRIYEKSDAELSALVNASYSYKDFFPALRRVVAKAPTATALPEIKDTAIQQIYISYFYDMKKMPQTSLTGEEFVDFLLATIRANETVAAQLPADMIAKLADMKTIGAFINNKEALDYTEMTDSISELQSNISSVSTGNKMSESMLSGVYIKRAIHDNMGLTSPIMACDLVNFLDREVGTNPLLKNKVTDSAKETLAAAKAEIERGESLFISENYARALITVRVADEGAETTAFVSNLLLKVDEIFGEGAYITGEVISTYDLQSSFETDNMIISVFTIVSIFFIILITFKSISIPSVLVAVIQGAMWIAFATSLLEGSSIFFMSYIITSCILMGATIDYGILMSSNYVAFRKSYDRKESIYKAVAAAMPTVFTSGLLLTVCGFVIDAISSQDSISSVGYLIGKGTLVSIFLITVLLPSILYLGDKIILKLVMKDEASARYKTVIFGAIDKFFGAIGSALYKIGFIKAIVDYIKAKINVKKIKRSLDLKKKKFKASAKRVIKQLKKKLGITRLEKAMAAQNKKLKAWWRKKKKVIKRKYKASALARLVNKITKWFRARKRQTTRFFNKLSDTIRKMLTPIAKKFGIDLKKKKKKKESVDDGFLGYDTSDADKSEEDTEEGDSENTEDYSDPSDPKDAE
ncbi:MAG: MMPL family transporter [Clostridia bacterium]|nr:MMPL family transporter [Clostridia bacterium]